ncbi:MAG: penicillin-binding protein [Ruminococcaceae bacterium]|nr:penicillin-binding protein [Oscillospiraceae bacterium]
MKQLKHRAILVLLLTALLAGGTLLFCIKYVSDGADWAAFRANDHTYTDGRLANGQILDRNGTVLYDALAGSYHESGTLRRATLHAVGDLQGNISTSALSAFQERLVGFDPITGTTGGGNALYLTIDADLQATAYEALNGRKGTVGLYNYRTGEILCMVSNPSFDPANAPTISDGDSRYDGVYINRLLSATFTPGSVFKVVTTAAAIEQLDDIFQRSFTCTGSLPMGDDTITCPSAHGEMDFYGAFANSCNCVYAQLAQELGGETLARYAREGGLLQTHTVNGLPTAAGTFVVAEQLHNLGWSAVGQYHDLINPCSLMVLMGSIAGDGTAVEPTLIHKQLPLNGLGLSSSAGIPGSIRTWRSSTCRTLQKMMANNVAVTYGQDRFGDLSVCAKSGTAEVGDGMAPHAWFTGFLTDSEYPLAFVVLVENGGSGASAAGSVAARLLAAATDSE